MNYGLAKNPHKINALNRGNSKAPINNLIAPQRFQTGGSVRALQEIMPYSPESSLEEVEKGWGRMGASVSRRRAREANQKQAEADLKKLQKKAKRGWFNNYGVI